MVILYIHQYFSTPKGSTGTRSYEFARRWVKAGHSVIILTTTAQLMHEEISHSKGRLIKRFNIDGINICALNLPYNQKMGVIKRSLSFIGFCVLASFFILFTKKPDVVYATSTPLTVGIPALVAKWLRRIPFVFEVRDQWPEIPIELGIIKKRVMIKILLWLEKTIYKNSTAIVAGSPGQADGIKKIAANDKLVKVIPNSCDIEMFRPDIDGSSIRKEYHWDNKLVFLHAGAMGKINDLGFVVDAALKLRNTPEILFVLLGEGNQKPVLEEKVKKHNLNNVLILPSVPKEELTVFFAASDIGLVIIGKYPIIEHNSANKFFDSLSAGKPVLLNYSGWQREILENNNAGLGCKLCDIDEFVNKVLHLNSRRALLEEMKKNARRIAEQKFSREKLSLQALNILEATVS